MKRVASLGAVAAAVTVVLGLGPLARPAWAQTPRAPAPAPALQDEPHREGV